MAVTIVVKFRLLPWKKIIKKKEKKNKKNEALSLFLVK